MLFNLGWMGTWTGEIQTPNGPKHPIEMGSVLGVQKNLLFLMMHAGLWVGGGGGAECRLAECRSA